MFLFESIEQAKMYDRYAALPKTILDNLNPRFKIRGYQDEAFRNYVTYFENPNLRKNGNRTLFHMATGSGKTYIMAGLILYLYQKGYRNFLFFVPLSNIVSKTIDNLTVSSSSKYLFADSIVIDGEPVQIRKVNTFEDSADDAINICFTTVQQIHHDYWDVRENGITAEEFSDRKIVFISDEAHHINADTSKKQSKDEELESRSWEYVVKKLYKANPDNIMLEFTATCKLDNPNIRKEYENKIVYNYDLKHFRHDRYSKEVQTLQSGLDFIDMCFQAMIISQYRLHLFNDLHQDIKPVVLFKSAKIAESQEFVELFEKTLSSLNGAYLERFTEIELSIVKKAFNYFSEKGISLDLLAQELKEGFGPDKIVQINNDSSIKTNSKLLNTLESKDNPIRAIFEVKALDEGWDVLNLFDIVRLYDTRDAKNGVPGKTTIQEAQLIGRGARYCPFVVDDENERFLRKFDDDLENRYRICEEMYYHCHTNSKYIDELHKALVETGMMDQNVTVQELKLKDDFKQSRLYRDGIVLVNEQVDLGEIKFDSFPDSIKSKIYTYRASNKSAELTNIINLEITTQTPHETKTFTYTVRQISEVNYNIVHSALRRFPRLKFSYLKETYPSLESMKDFIMSEDFLGSIRIDIVSSDDEPSLEDLHRACVDMANHISEGLGDIKRSFKGSENFKAVPFRSIFFDKLVNYADPMGEGIGVPQSQSHQWRLDLSEKDWYAFNENYGSGEEKGFVKYFSERVHSLQSVYDSVFLVRNERHMHIYSFDEGRRFEPDFLLFLGKEGEPIHQLQVFIEPKGENLLQTDAWKQQFLLEMEEKYAIDPSVLQTGTEYSIMGLPFYNNTIRKDFDESFEELGTVPEKWIGK